MSTNWNAVRTGNLDALAAAVMERTSDQRDDPSSREQEYADTILALVERCKAAEAALAALPSETTRDACVAHEVECYNTGWRAAMERAAEIADGWAAQYPPDVFPSPPSTPDGYSGVMGRHVATMIAKDIREGRDPDYTRRLHKAPWPWVPAAPETPPSDPGAVRCVHGVTLCMECAYDDYAEPSAAAASPREDPPGAREAAIEECARIVDRWHISKGGFSELAWQIRALASPPSPTNAEKE